MKTITVKGSSRIEKIISEYRAKIIMSKEQSDFAGETVDTIEEMKSSYYHALVEDGINVNKFVENEIEFLSQNNYDLGTMLIYTCKSFDEIKELLAIKLPSIYSTTLEVKWINQSSYDALLEASMADAKRRGANIAANLGSKIKNVISVNEQNNSDSYWTYYSPYDDFFSVEVVFEIA